MTIRYILRHLFAPIEETPISDQAMRLIDEIVLFKEEFETHPERYRARE